MNVLFDNIALYNITFFIWMKTLEIILNGFDGNL